MICFRVWVEGDGRMDTERANNCWKGLDRGGLLEGGLAGVINGWVGLMAGWVWVG